MVKRSDFQAAFFIINAFKSLFKLSQTPFNIGQYEWQ
jgi:hypothetical protein